MNGVNMLSSKKPKSLLGGALAACVLMVGAPTAIAGSKYIYEPDFGNPFPDLYWSGETIIEDGTCTAIGDVSNFGSPCGGQFSFQNTTLTLASKTNLGSSQTQSSLTGADVISVQRTGLSFSEYEGVVGTPFNPIQFRSVAAANYRDAPAWFSLVMLPETKVQLFWFKNDPGVYSSSNAFYKDCAKPGDNAVGDNRCGQSTFASLAVFAPVPEPSTYAMMLAGIGAVGFIARRRRGKA